MSTIVTRAGKGSALTHNEADANFTNLNTDKLENVVEDTTPQLGGDLDAQSTYKITNLVDPTADQDAATKLYVDNTVAGAAVTSSTQTIIEIRNASGASIAKGVPVYIAGHSGGKILIAPADADDAAKMPAIGLLNGTLANNTDGEVVAFGTLEGINTSTFTVGDTLYIDTTPGGTTFGGLTNSAPTGESSAIQNIGKVARSDSNGTIIVSGPGRSNATPNLDEDQFFLGNASNQSVATDFSTAVEAISINSLVEDTTPELGGDLDILSRKITSSTAELTIDGVNGIKLLESYDAGSPTGLSALYAEASKDLLLTGNGGDYTTAGYIQVQANGTVNVNRSGTGNVAINGVNYPTSAGTSGQFMKTNGTTLSLASIVEADITDLGSYIGLTDLSVGAEGAASGDGAISYDNTTGTFSYTPPDLSSYLTSVNGDTAPVLGGPLNTAGYEIRGATGNIILNPQANALVLDYTNWPSSDGTSGQALTTDGIGQLSWDTVATLTTFSVGAEAPASGDGAISYDNTTGVFTYTPPTASGLGALANVQDDTGPTLGGNLDTNGNIITSSGNADVTLTAAGTGSVVVNKINYPYEKMGATTGHSGTFTPDVTDGNLHYVALGGNITINDMTSPTIGATVTLILDGTAGSYTGTFGSKLFFAGGAKTLTAGGIDVLTMTCVDDTTSAELYLCSLATNFS